MKVIEILNFNRELLNRLLATGIRLEDSRYVELYNEYREMLQKGEKVTYIVASLAEKYGICERNVYYLVKRLNGECNPVAP
ncbi:MAG: hypothetical protein GAN75_02095 [Bacteroidales bacterium]